MLDRLWVRLLLAFLVVLAVAGASIALLADRATEQTVDEHAAEVLAARDQRIQSTFSRYWANNQSWDGVDMIVNRLATLSATRLVLTDTSRNVLIDSAGITTGQRLDRRAPGQRIPIMHEGNRVGNVYLRPLDAGANLAPSGDELVQALRNNLATAGLIGALAALLISLILARSLAAPLEALTTAARRLSRGDLDQRVQTRVGGELGQLAQAFNTMADALARGEAVRRRMVTNVAHELRTPLANLRGYLEAIQDGVAQPDQKTLNLLNREALQLSRLVEDLQELAQAEARQLKLAGSDLDLTEVISLQVRSAEPRAAQKAISLRLTAPETLPACGDAQRLTQVVANLLDNAIRHTPLGGQIEVVLSQRSSPEAHQGTPLAELAVRNSGSFLSESERVAVFERLYRTDEARSRQAGGFGLGLSIAKEIVEAHGGTISAASDPQAGTTFTVLLPLRRSTALGAATETEADELVAAGERPAGALGLILNGAMLGLLTGSAAGVLEATLVLGGSLLEPRYQELASYAVVFYGVLFGLAGGLAGGGAFALSRVLHFQLFTRHVAEWGVPIGLVALSLAIFRGWWSELTAEVIESRAALAVGLLVLAASASLAFYLVRLGSAVVPERLRRFPILPIALLPLLGLASLVVFRDLGVRGFWTGGASGVEASPPILMALRLAPGAESGRSPLAAAASAAAPVVPPLSQMPNVILVSIDSLRADYVGAYGRTRVSTPNLDRLAAEGVRFEHVLVQQPNTTPSHASLLTGTYPSTHGVREHMADVLDGSVPTLAETLAQIGFNTAAFYSWFSFEPAYSGFQRGFRTYENHTVNVPSLLANRQVQALAAGYKRITEALPLAQALDARLGTAGNVEKEMDGRANVTSDAVIRWLQRQPRQPFFIWLHYFDPHYPYTPPPPFDTMYVEPCSTCIDGGWNTIEAIADGRPFTQAEADRLKGLYAGEVSFTDRELGRLVSKLEELGLWDNTLVVVTSDHGENFLEHDLWVHGLGLYNTEIHVPLLMRLPQRLGRGRVVEAPAGLVDIAPTILDVLNIPVPEAVEGRSLLPVLDGRESGLDRAAFSQFGDDSLVALIWRNWKMIMDTWTRTGELYDLASDPAELRDVWAGEPEVVARMQELVEQWMAAR